MRDHLRVALVHDYLREYGGAERVLETLHTMFPEAPLYTAFVDRAALGKHWQRFADWKIHQSVAAKIPGIHRLFSPLRVLSAYFFEGFDLSEYDVVISSTNMYMAKAVLTGPETKHICYIHTPPRSLYGYTTGSNWKKNPLIRILGELINVRMRQVDYATAARPDILVANSREVQQRIQKWYRRDSIVINPPVALLDKSIVAHTQRTYYLYVNRLAYAKHPDLAVAACTKLSLPLKVVGVGPMEAAMRQVAGPTIEFLGAVDDERLASLYAGAIALVYPVEDEDFGMVPVEAQGFGTPVIAHRSGGPLETIKEGETGIFFDELSLDSLCAALKQFQSLSFDHARIHTHAQQYSPAHFMQQMKALIV